MRERGERLRAEWAAGIVRLGGVGIFAGISDPVLHESWLDAARDLLDKNRDHLRQFALPISFLQRHALELALKYSITAAARYHRAACRCAGPEPQAPQHHNLKVLLGHFKDWLGPDAKDNESLPLLEAPVRRFHKLDARGTWARYREDSAVAVLDLDAAQRELDDLFKRLFVDDPDAPVGWIKEYEYMTHELCVREELVSGDQAPSAESAA